MSKINILNSCLSGASEESCVLRINEFITMPNILLQACMLFMTIAAVCSIIELSSRNGRKGGVINFVASCALSSYLAFIPIGVYSLKVFEADDEIINTFISASWYHQMNELGTQKNT